MGFGLVNQNPILNALFDAIPSPAFIVDPDVKILGSNDAASSVVPGVPQIAVRRRCGDVFGCVHALASTGGCGTTGACKVCAIRCSVKEACTGTNVTRKKHALELSRKPNVLTLQIWVTTRAFCLDEEKHVFVILEDVTELIELRSIIPICVKCKKIRDSQEYWEQVESYIGRQLDVQFSHSICPECKKKLYPWMS